MKIEDVIAHAVVIDNKEEEGNGIVNALKQADVHVDFIQVKSDGSEDDITTYPHPRELIFADLLLNENPEDLKTNISRLIGIINKLQPDNAKFYGIVVWTKHTNLTGDFLKRISKAVKLGMDFREKEEEKGDNEEEVSTKVYLRNPPLFILQLDKMVYNEEGEWNFGNLLHDINIELEKSKTAYFSLRWKQKVNEAIDNVINQIYQLATDYNKYEDELPFLLRELSKNETGEKEDKGLTVGAYKAFDHLLHSELASIIRNETYPELSGISNNPYGDDIKKMQIMSAKINASLFIDNHNLDTKEILPGNIYRILDVDSPLNVPEAETVEIPLKESDTGCFTLGKNYSKANVAIELTPPCDFSNKKIYSRYIGGYIFDIPLGKFKLGKRNNKIFESPREDKRYALSPVLVSSDEHVKCIVFDFRYLWTLTENEINDESKYKLWLKAKPGLFADILQKFSSHASRLGINDIHLER